MIETSDRWHPQARAYLDDPATDISEVITHTIRHETWIDYEVRVGQRDKTGCFEEGEGERAVWCESIEFGTTEATRSGGMAFVLAAREQESVAHMLWEKHVAKLGGAK